MNAGAGWEVVEGGLLALLGLKGGEEQGMEG